MRYWYSFATFRHTRAQNFWALQEWEYFDADCWPPEPQVDPVNNDRGEYMTDVLEDDEKGKPNQNGKLPKVWIEQIRAGVSVAAGAQGHQVQSEGRFVKCRVIIGEINRRLALTGKDGVTLKQEIERGKVCEIDDLSDAARNALDYISWGREPRRQSYSEWIASHKHYNKSIAQKRGASIKSQEKCIMRS